MERKLKRISILIVILLSLIVSCSREKGSEGLITASGTIEATDVYVRTEVPGIILDYKLKEGDRVEQGDLICRLDSEKLEIQLQQARAKQKELQYRLELIRKGARVEEKERAKSSLEKALSNLKDSERDYERAKELLKDEALPPAELDKAKLRVEVNQRLVEIAQKEYEIIQQGSRPE
ncbi:MAG: biotin/lipoyl-binding protein, partial [Candidatus Aminicenantes bacterium]|nr:biotin/lipoyl-binding protein [Candidatus Aminicenantes bacterium]